MDLRWLAESDVDTGRAGRVSRMIDNKDMWLNSARGVLARTISGHSSEAVQFATSMLTAFHGPRSTQLKAFTEGLEMDSRRAANATDADWHHLARARGAITNAVAEVEGGLITSLRVLVAGEMLSELVRLGKEVLETKTEEAKNVAAVLVAAAFEDLMRRMGEEFASVTGRPKLEDVINALKSAEVLKGGQVGTALSYLQFRNDSLHADWNKVDRSQVESCIAFIEALLLKHFS